MSNDDIAPEQRGGPHQPSTGRPSTGRPSRQGRGGSLAWRSGGEVIKAGNLEFERVLFFSDAVFAIAITLLVVDLRVPISTTIRSAHVLREAVPEMIGFGIGFVVIGIFWIGHHSLYRRIVAMNGSVIRLNLLFLGTIAFLPYPTALLSATSGQVASVIFYAVCVAAAGLTEAAIWLYALRVPGLVSADMPARQRRDVSLRILVAPLVFLVSIPIAIVAPDPAEYVWIMVAVLNVFVSHLARRDEDRNSRDEVSA